MITDEIRTSFSTFLQQSLNEQQRLAVEQLQGVQLVIAGAGSGKTRIITARITHLMINEQIPASSIVALTFTNKAAREMKERIEQFTQRARIALPFIGTFHGYCLQLLKRHANLCRIPNFTIIDEDDQEQLLSQLIKRHHLQKKITASQLAHKISQLKNNQQTSKSDIQDSLLYELYQAYEQEKERAHCFDFDDLLLEVVDLFKRNPAFVAQWQQNIRHILVDEYQDTNRVQHQLLTSMALTGPKSLAVDSLCVVGDEDQSIYSWRGATVSNIMNFTADFPTTRLITVEQNYRSRQPILEAANHLITHNKQRNPKRLWSEKKGNNCIALLMCNTEYQEGDVIAHLLALLKSKLDGCAILYRAHYQSRAIEEALIKKGIAYRIIGGIQFWARKEVKDILAYARLVANPFDRVACLRIINTPSRGLGDKFEEQLQQAWAQEPLLSCIEIIEWFVRTNTMGTLKQQAMQSFLNLFQSLTTDMSAYEVLTTIVQKTSYLPYLQKAYEPADAASKIENVKELLNAAQHFFDQGITSLPDMLNHITLFQEQLQDTESSDTIQLMTLHAAKGLEFDTVIVSGIEEGLLPSSRSVHLPEALEEERRLLYVGITRAKERLLLTHAQARRTYGTWDYKKPSSFLKEIPAHLITYHDASYWNHTDAAEFFMQWLGMKTLSRPLPHKVNLEPPPATPVALKPYQSVKHATFGTGIIQQVEQKNNGSCYATVQFKSGRKIIDARFLQPA